MASVTFSLKDAKGEQPNKPSSIILTLTYHRKRVRIYTGEMIEPRKWDSARKRVKPSAADSAALNDQLSAKEATVLTIYRKLSANGNSPTVAAIKTAYEEERNGTERTPYFIEYFETFIELMQEIRKSNTLRNYRLNLGYMRKFEQKTRKRLKFEDMTVGMYDQFVSYFTKDNYAINTIGGIIKDVKVVMRHAFDNGITENQDFRKFKVIQEEVLSTYLNEEELQQLYDLDLSNDPRFERVRDLFLIGCWTGLRFSDFSRLTTDNISGDFLHVPTIKTGKTVTIPIHPVVRRILDKYNGHLPKSISNQKTNEYLKEVCKIAGFEDHIMTTITKGGKKVTDFRPKWEQITSHTARRSFATNLYNDNFPTIDLMKITGHKTETAFLKYIKVTQEEAAQKLAKHWANRTAKTGNFKVAN